MGAHSILAVNAGSSSLKCALFDVADDVVEPRLTFNVANPSAGLGGFVACLQEVLDNIRKVGGLDELLAVGHRVVHGGDLFHGPVVVNADVLAELRQLSSLAPLHQPVNLKLIEACQQQLPGVPQVACFDTMFHQHMPDVSRNYALPQVLTDAGVRGYGFHGISYEYVWERLRALDENARNKRIIVAHLGAGASLCAIKAGQSIATTMGFSTADGLPMATRTGSLDPGVLIHLMREHNLDADALEHLVYKEGGLHAISGISGDMRELRASSDRRARAAIEFFVYRVIREIGSLLAALGGLDVLVFTGGIGANDASTRREITEAFAWYGIEIDGRANANAAAIVSTTESRVDVRVIPANEEAMTAIHAIRVLSGGQSPIVA
ncbi:MAG: acetate/propionate family kinase [Gammaproteobacteria bacterium]|nr:acetate/propionate family kinase [Gammaproteobacteria bacterium]